MELGKIVADKGLDTNGDGRFDELIVDVEVTSSQAIEVQFGGILLAGENSIRANPDHTTLTPGKQTIQISFNGQLIGDTEVDGPYQVGAVWIAEPDKSIVTIVDPDEMLDYQEFTYSTEAYKAIDFEFTAASMIDDYSHEGVDSDGNGLYEALVINVPLKIKLPGTFLVEGDLYDGLGNFVGQASWTGSDSSGLVEI